YRTNLIWEDDALRIRDIHLFHEDFPSVYTKEVATTNECNFFTLPVVDGYLWSNSETLAGLRLKAIVDGEAVLIKGGKPEIKSSGRGKLEISWPLTDIEGQLEMKFTEDEMDFRLVHG